MVGVFKTLLKSCKDRLFDWVASVLTANKDRSTSGFDHDFGQVRVRVRVCDCVCVLAVCVVCVVCAVRCCLCFLCLSLCCLGGGARHPNGTSTKL